MTNGARPTFHCLRAYTYGLISSVEVNRVPIAADPTGAGLTKVRSINEWIRPGENELSVWLSWAADPELDPAEAELQCSVFRADPASEFPEPAEVLAEFAWPIARPPDEAGAEEAGEPPEEGGAAEKAEERPKPEQMIPYAAFLPFTPAAPPETRLWSEAEPLATLTDDDRRRILSAVNELGRAIADGEAERAFEMCRYRFEEDVRANGTTLDGLRSSVTKMWRMFVNQPDLRVPPLEPPEARFEVQGGGRVVQVLRGSSPNAVSIEGPELTAAVGLWVAKIGGDWKIVR